MADVKVFNPYRMFVGAYIPNALLRHKEVSAGAKLTWARLAQYAGKNGKAWPKLETLADDLGVSKPTVIKYIKELVSAGFIAVDNPKGADRLAHKSNRYYFLWHPIFEDELNTEDDFASDSKQGFTPGCKPGFTPKERESYERESYENKYMDVFNHWNSKKGVIHHKKLTDDMKKAIKGALKKPGIDIETIKLAIDRLSLAVNDKKYFYEHKWALDKFLKQSNGFRNWLDEGQYWENYKTGTKNDDDFLDFDGIKIL
jgi:biotin operon repressor